jgi:hypothetical protein
MGRCPRGSASLRRSARRDDGNAPDHGTWRVATRSTLSPAPGWQHHEGAQPGPASAGAQARRPLNHTAGGGPAAAGWWRVPGGLYDTHATNRLTRRPAWTCWVIAQDPVCPAHPPCSLRRAHHQHVDRGHARDADLDRNRPPGTAAPIRPKNASSRDRTGGEGRVRVRHCSADNSRITLSTYRLARGRRVHSSAVSSRQAARYSSEIRCRSATKLGSVPISEIS